MGNEAPRRDADATLDPADWTAFRATAHGMLDDILDYLEDIRDRPVWRPIPAAVRERFRGELPAEPSELAAVHEEFMRYVLPYAAGNVHPGFLGWVHGAGTPVGVVAEMLSAGLNANLGGRDHIPIEVERQVAGWMRGLFGFPESATGLFVTGASMANLVGVLVARDTELGFETRCAGVAAGGKRLAAYASAAVHGCIARALDIAGIGSDALRRIAVDGRYRIDLGALGAAIDADRRAGFTPFLLVGTAGTVDTGAIDDLDTLAALARAEGLWFHVDGACGALAMLAPSLAPRLKGIECADSLAFDFHKWGQVPYDAGFVLVRDGVLHRRTFATSAPYLRREAQGLAAGSPWPCDYGPDLSRGFRALKTWFTFKVYGAAAIGASIERTCELARYLESRVARTPELELAAPVELNVVCFRYRAEEAHRVNARIAVELQESGVAAPSTTVVGGKLAIRAAIVNHRTRTADLDALVERTVAFGRGLRDRAAGSTAAASGAATDWPPRLAREAALLALETRIAAEPEAVVLRLDRARLLTELGRTLEARNAYLEILGRVPSDRRALNNLGTLLHSTGYRTAARTAYAEAAARHPDDAMSHVNLANVLFENGEPGPAREHYEAALRCAPGYPEAHQGLSYVLAEMGDAEGAARHRRKGFEGRAVLPMPYRGEGPPVPLLLLISAVGGNIPTRNFLDDRVFQTTVVVPEFYDFRQLLPRHQLVFNAIGDADLAAEALLAAQSVAALTGAPMLNAPAAVMATGRADNAERLSRLRGVVAPATVTLARELLMAADAETTLARHGLRFPLLLRTPGFHTGRHFVLVDRAEVLAEAVAGLPGAELIAIQYLDSRGADGKVRKYRVMMINGCLYPLHLAIASHWKIHYFTAEMAERGEHRAEDAEFLENMPGVLGPRAMAALEQIQAALGLDYAGIDFGLSPAGDLLLFEANATMVVNPPEPDERWAYRRPALERIFAAVRGMLLEKAGR
ncbi:MAG: pyridoxal-dependent decarboxylase [Bryobacteraceae bacterium]|jgi:glutamate/tyrosine decarboxylase-like PLP-dependent enzyme/Flp pilus assembly protein TadD